VDLYERNQSDLDGATSLAALAAAWLVSFPCCSGLLSSVDALDVKHARLKGPLAW